MEERDPTHHERAVSSQLCRGGTNKGEGVRFDWLGEIRFFFNSESSRGELIISSRELEDVRGVSSGRERMGESRKKERGIAAFLHRINL